MSLPASPQPTPPPRAGGIPADAPRWAALVPVLVALAFVVLGCSVKNADRFDQAIVLDPTPTVTPTPTPVPDLPPTISAPNLIQAVIGGEVAVDFVVSDDNGDAVSGLENVPPGVVQVEGSTTRYTWKPTQPGTWVAIIRAVDNVGQETTADVTFVSRYPTNPSFVVAMGDSVASGHGLDTSDYITGDDCFRSDKGYPSRVVEGLIAEQWLPTDGRVAVVACTGTTAEHLMTKEFTGGFAETAPSGTDKLTQVEWAVRANPALILITVGVNDVGFINPERFFRADNVVNSVVVAEGVYSLEQGLEAALNELIASTDAVIVVTEYYNPTAPNPQGFDGCRTECFRTATEGVVTEINSTLATVVAGYDQRRVRLVRLQDLFDGHGAPNGLGPDGLREAEGWIGDLTGNFLGGIQPFCAKGETQGEPWINNLDCVHPTETGAQQIADQIIAELTGS